MLLAMTATKVRIINILAFKHFECIQVSRALCERIE
jgi:hypothetical protein